jgi:hypothetical protein
MFAVQPGSKQLLIPALLRLSGVSAFSAALPTSSAARVAIDPAEAMFRVFPAEPSDTPETATLAIQLVDLDAEVKSLKDLLDEAKSNLDELHQWRERTEQFLADQQRPWWRRLVG